MDKDKLNFIRNLYKPEPQPIEKYQVKEADIELILKQVKTTRKKAIETLNQYNGNLVETIINLFN